MREVERNGDSLKRGGAKLLARMLPRMLDKTSTNPIATGSLVQRTANTEGVMDPELSLTACQKATGNVVWTPEKLLDLPGAAEESSFLEDVRPTIQLTLQPYQHAQASLFAGVGGVGLSSAEARRMSMSVGSLVATVSEVLADMSGAIGDKVRRDLPDSHLVRRIWNSVRDLCDVHGVSEEAMANIMPDRWRERAFRERRASCLRGVSCESVAGTRRLNYQPPAKRSINWGSWQTESVMRGRSLRWTSSARRRPREAWAVHKERRRREIWRGDQGLPSL